MYGYPRASIPSGPVIWLFFQTLSELNWPVERWRQPLSCLSDYGNGNVLIITRAKAGSRVNFSDQETDLLEDWVKKGNTLLLLGALGEWDDTRTFLRQIGFYRAGNEKFRVRLLPALSAGEGTDN